MPGDEKIITEIEEIGKDFKKKLNKSLAERDQKIKKILKNRDEEEIKKISSSLKS